MFPTPAVTRAGDGAAASVGGHRLALFMYDTP